MRFAIQTPPEHTDFPMLADVWRAADDAGLWGAFTFDHLVPLNDLRPGVPEPARVPPGPQLEGWTTLAALAASTRRLRVGTLATGVTYRHPVLLAKMAVTLDHVTGGRAILGVGAAWHRTEHEMYGIPFPEVGERMGRLEETLETFHLLCRQEVTDYEGRHVRLREAVFEPKPVNPDGIPVLVGGSGPRLRRIAARHADLFNSFPPPWEWRALNDGLDEACRSVGRHPGDLVRSVLVFVELSGDREREERVVRHVQRTRGGTEEEVRSRILVGTPEDMARVARSYEAAGVSLIVMNLRPPFTPEGIDRFAREVVPAVAG
ncbi:MAG: LLM class flavin-dependent oxidoreductase [Actinobacteria bacterium]|nr:LLM class flavin-dependent oxidoreductase [Actinomycetota bacterium]